MDTKVCGVCGDKALGYNFNAVTCESCKAFFRRNALIQKVFKCPFSNQCRITTVTRRFCQKCRLDKCFAIGMCKDLIMSEEDKVLKRQKIEENRAKKRNIGTSKGGLKKIKRESMEGDSQESELYNSSYATDSDSKDTSLSEGYQPNNPNLVSVINYTNNAEAEKARVDDRITLINERLVSSSDELPSFENVLGSQQDYNTSNNLDNRLNNIVAFSNLVNNNSVPYSNNTNDEATVDQSESKTTLDVTRDVLRDVQRLL